MSKTKDEVITKMNADPFCIISAFVEGCPTNVMWGKWSENNTVTTLSTLLAECNLPFLSLAVKDEVRGIGWVGALRHCADMNTITTLEGKCGAREAGYPWSPYPDEPFVPKKAAEQVDVAMANVAPDTIDPQPSVAVSSQRRRLPAWIRKAYVYFFFIIIPCVGACVLVHFLGFRDMCITFSVLSIAFVSFLVGSWLWES